MWSGFLCLKTRYNLKDYGLQCYIDNPYFYYPGHFAEGPQDQ